MAERMRIDGRCHCGRVSFVAEIDPSRVAICHCTDCQSLTGSAFRVTVSAAPSDIAMTGAEPKRYTKHGDNGRRRFQDFCPDCGSPLFTSGEGEDAGEWGIRWGSIRQRAALVPRRQIWCRSMVPWLGEVDGLAASAADDAPAAEG